MTLPNNNSSKNLTEDWWDVLMLSPHASVRDIHQAYETLRMSYLPINRDRSIPISPKASEQLQKLDRTFRIALDSKNPSATRSIKTASKQSSKAAPRAPSSQKDPFHSIVQEWTKTSSQGPLLTTSSAAANSPRRTSTPATTITKSAEPAVKSATGDTEAPKKGVSVYIVRFMWCVSIIFVIIIGWADRKSRERQVDAQLNAFIQKPSPQYNPAQTVADPLVVALQQELNRRGFNAGVVDGLIGPQTSSAISAAQSSFNMFIDGAPSEKLLWMLRAN